MSCVTNPADLLTAQIPQPPDWKGCAYSFLGWHFSCTSDPAHSMASLGLHLSLCSVTAITLRLFLAATFAVLPRHAFLECPGSGLRIPLCCHHTPGAHIWVLDVPTAAETQQVWEGS